MSDSPQNMQEAIRALARQLAIVTARLQRMENDKKSESAPYDVTPAPFVSGGAPFDHLEVGGRLRKAMAGRTLTIEGPPAETEDTVSGLVRVDSEALALNPPSETVMKRAGNQELAAYNIVSAFGAGGPILAVDPPPTYFARSLLYIRHTEDDDLRELQYVVPDAEFEKIGAGLESFYRSIEIEETEGLTPAGAASDGPMLQLYDFANPQASDLETDDKFVIRRPKANGAEVRYLSLDEVGAGAVKVDTDNQALVPPSKTIIHRNLVPEIATHNIEAAFGAGGPVLSVDAEGDAKSLMFIRHTLEDDLRVLEHVVPDAEFEKIGAALESKYRSIEIETGEGLIPAGANSDGHMIQLYDWIAPVAAELETDDLFLIRRPKTIGADTGADLKYLSLDEVADGVVSSAVKIDSESPDDAPPSETIMRRTVAGELATFNIEETFANGGTLDAEEEYEAKSLMFIKHGHAGDLKTLEHVVPDAEFSKALTGGAKFASIEIDTSEGAQAAGGDTVGHRLQLWQFDTDVESEIDESTDRILIRRAPGANGETAELRYAKIPAAVTSVAMSIFDIEQTAVNKVKMRAARNSTKMVSYQGVWTAVGTGTAAFGTEYTLSNGTTFFYVKLEVGSTDPAFTLEKGATLPDGGDDLGSGTADDFIPLWEVVVAAGEITALVDWRTAMKVSSMS